MWELLREASSKQHTLVTGNAKKDSLNLSGKLEWLCLQHRQAWSRPQSPVKWESVGTGQGWMLQWSSSVERTYRECERPWHHWGARTKPCWMYPSCSLRARQVHNQRANWAYTSTELAYVMAFTMLSRKKLLNFSILFELLIYIHSARATIQRRYAMCIIVNYSLLQLFISQEAHFMFFLSLNF